MLYPTPALRPADDQVLGEIEGMREALRHQIQTTPSRWTAGLRKFLTADAVAASNSIEGFKVSTIDVEDLMDGERDVEVSDENREETLAYQRMMTYIQTLHDAEDFSYSKGLLNALHWMLQGHHHTQRKPAGQWRGGPVYVTDARDPSIAAYTAPAADVVPALMKELIDWLNTDSGERRCQPWRRSRREVVPSLAGSGESRSVVVRRTTARAIYSEPCPPGSCQPILVKAPQP
jgi:Fic family protein